MEEQNQEKATATQHVTVADAAAPETGNGKKEDKGGGKKEKKTAKPLTPKQLQQRKKLMVYPLMGSAVPRLDVADIRTFGGAGREPGHRGGVQRRHPPAGE